MRDANGDLPYVAKKLCIADESHKKSGGSRSSTTSSSAGVADKAGGSRSAHLVGLQQACLGPLLQWTARFPLLSSGLVGAAVVLPPPVGKGGEGPKFTWCNREDPNSNVRCRLDRAVANSAFTSLFDECSVENVIATTSDHYPILGVAGSLRSWSKEAFGSIHKKIGKMERQLASIRASPPSPASLSEEKHIESQLCELFEREEIMECQRSRVDWLKAGDHNTEFFQARASARRRRNRIHSLLREDGSTCNSQGQIKGLVQSYYEKLFTSEPRPTADEVLEAIPHKVTAEMNADLCKPYSDEEIKAALFQMGLTKAPGPDGFPALFYQHHWNFLGEDICQASYSRLITDTTLIAYECLHTIRKQRVKKPFFALKIDMMKAYDRVEWSYLHQCLTKLGFAPSWIEIVMRCVTNIRGGDERMGWSLRTDPRSLCAQVLKGRYFPFTDFWSATAPGSASATWRAILHGRDLLKKGVQWGIGDGRNTYILKDHWIPSTPDLLQPLYPIPVSATVHCLIDEDNGCWNEETVRAFFSDEVANDILQIPINLEGGSDFARWPLTRFGEYTVRSVYNMARTSRFLCDRSASGRGLSSNWSMEERMWKKLWKVQAPNKMKIMLWRLAHDCMPSGEQLQRRQVPTRTDCFFCGRPEGIEHALLLYVHAQAVWDEIKVAFGIKLCCSSFTSPKQWLFNLLERGSDRDISVITVTLWHIWEARNAARNEPEAPPPKRTAARARGYIDMIFQNLFKSAVADPQVTPASSSSWTPPPHGTLLVFADAAVDIE
ncbi:uncharacterized protein [Aegilops tauschii subsp. strangulata]|uniref:uncharacterized protein n=1 Tax=Aegilops tauschii subsp. strangulata TaxID=200361 RepID=UPI003CC8ACE5